MIKVKNPFVIGKYVSDAYFCDRERETQQLAKHIENGRNVFFTAPRRMGKTGLIQHYFAQQAIQAEYHTFFIDLYGTSSFGELVFLLGQAVFESLKPKSKGITEKMISFLKAIHIGMKIDAATGEPSMDIGLGSIDTPDTTLDEIFRYLEQADKPCIIAFDEFQQIMNYDEKNVEAILRTKIQHARNTSFIYAGSKRHLISQMFNSPSKPFYASSVAMRLDAIPLDKYTAFSTQKFHEFNRNIKADVIREVYDRYEGCTWYVHSMLNELFALTEQGETCTMEMLPTAWENICVAQRDNYLQFINLLTSKQKMVLKAIAKEGIAQQPTSGTFLRKYNLPSASSVQSALQGLLEKDVVTRNEDGSYRVYDYFLRQWLRETH